MEGWAEFVDEMRQYYNVELDCLSGGGPKESVPELELAVTCENA
jgi:hypothetical protein